MQSIEKQIEDIISEYLREADGIIDRDFGIVARETVQKLKTTSPKKTGKYASSWTVKKEPGTRGSVTYIVHNKEHYRLTHLLENGHVIRNKKGEWGRAPAHPHIKQAEQEAVAKIVKELENDL